MASNIQIERRIFINVENQCQQAHDTCVYKPSTIEYPINKTIAKKKGNQKKIIA